MDLTLVQRTNINFYFKLIQSSWMIIVGDESWIFSYDQAVSSQRPEFPSPKAAHQVEET